MFGFYVSFSVTWKLKQLRKVDLCKYAYIFHKTNVKHFKRLSYYCFGQLTFIFYRLGKQFYVGGIKKWNIHFFIHYTIHFVLLFKKCNQFGVNTYMIGETCFLFGNMSLVIFLYSCKSASLRFSLKRLNAAVRVCVFNLEDA